MRLYLYLLVLALLAPARAIGGALPDAVIERDDERFYYIGFEVRREQRRSAVPVPTPLQLALKNEEDYRRTYLDAFNILKGENSCSRFYGGPVVAVEVLNRLSAQLRRETLNNPRVGIRMSGSFVTYHNKTTGATFRLFSTATINSTGPFLNRNSSQNFQTLRIGDFPARGREARVLILLHELGHLVRRPDGSDWLLPNDGNNHLLSEENTLRVQEECRDQIRTIERHEPARPPDLRLARRDKPDDS